LELRARAGARRAAEAGASQVPRAAAGQRQIRDRVEFAHDFDDPIDRLEVRSGHGRVHRAVGHEQRFVETADLEREELGRSLRHALGEDLPNEIAHALERKTLARRDLGDRNAAIEEADDPRLTLAPFQARRSPCSNRPLAANGRSKKGFDGIWLLDFAHHYQNKYRT
jgi:hypothetical protein